MAIKANEIIQLRKDKGLTQTDLAELLGVARTTIVNYEKGGKIPDSKLALLEQVLKSNPERNQSLSEFTPLEIVEYISQNIEKFRALSIFRYVVGINEIEELREEIAKLRPNK